MKLTNFIILCFSLTLLSSCASYKAARQPDLSYNLEAQQNKIDNEGITLMIKCIHLKSEMKNYFDRDLLHYGILPVQIYIKNKSYPKTVVLNIDGINLIDFAGAKNPMLSCDQMIEKRKITLWYMIGTSVSLFDPTSFMIGSLETSDKIKKIQSSYESHSIKFGNLISGGVTEGFTFFSVPKDLNNLNGWKISVVLKDMETNKDIILDYGLNGTIVPPKERSEWGEDYVEKK